MTQDELAERLDQVLSMLDELEGAIARKYDDILVSNNEAARHLGCTPNTISRMIREGRLNRITIGDSTGIPFSSIMGRI